MTNAKVKALLCGLTAVNTSENGRLESSMVSELTLVKMVMRSKENGRTVVRSDGSGKMTSKVATICRCSRRSSKIESKNHQHFS